MSSAENRAAILKALDSLPPLHEVARKLIDQMNDDRTSARDLERTIRHDQALAARILKLANSSAYGKSRDIFHLTDAVVLLGHTTITNMVLGVGLADTVGNNSLPQFSARAWSHSLDCAAAAQALAQVTGLAEPEKAFVAGLMHDIGLLVMAQAVPQVLQEVLEADPADPLAMERSTMGLNHPQIGKRLLDQWNLPQVLCEAVRYHHAPKRKFLTTNPLVLLVALADILTTVNGTALYSHPASSDIFSLLKLCRLEADMVPAMFAALAASRREAEQLSEMVISPDPAVTRIEPEGDDQIPTFAVWTSTELRTAWYEGQLRHLGYSVVARDGLSATARSDSPGGILIADLHGMSPAERESVATFCRSYQVSPMLIDNGAQGLQDKVWAEAPRLPEVFSPDAFPNWLTAFSSC